LIASGNECTEFFEFVYLQKDECSNKHKSLELMPTNTMKIALASCPFPTSLDSGVEIVATYIANASQQKADVICFPESYLPGMRGIGREIAPHDPVKLKQALEHICSLAKKYAIYVVLPMDWDKDGKILNVAFGISDKGEVVGMQTKNQLDPSEDPTFIPGKDRFIFEIKGIKTGIVICHEGFRYPESVRWATSRGAQLIFHPHCTGSDTEGKLLQRWGDVENPYYEKAMMCRALENTVFFASVNYGFNYQESATSIIHPSGKCLMHDSYERPGLLVYDINISEATRLLASRYNPSLYN
jgi:predicted amidohydrolase